jgi:hypothetical protein
MPKRLRWLLERKPRAISAVLHIMLRAIEAHLRRGSAARAHARLGTVSFIHRFGASRNRHVHSHCCVIDGVFEPLEAAADVPETVRFGPAAALTPETVAAIAGQVRVRERQRFAHGGLIEADDVRELRALRAPPSRTADARSMPRCALARTIAPGWSDCCATVPAQPSRSIGWSDLTPHTSSIGCPSPSPMAPRR